MMRENAARSTASGSASAGRTPPGPRGHWLLGILPEYRFDPLGALTRWARQYGDVVRLRVGPGTMYLLNHPDYVKRVLQENHRNYRKEPFVMREVKLAAGENLFTSEGDYWLRQRRLMQPIFHRQRIASFGAVMAGSTLEMLDRWQAVPAGRRLDVEQEMMRLTLGIVGKSLFSVDLSDEANVFGPAFTITTGYVSHRLNHLFNLPLAVPTRRHRQFKQALKIVNRIVDDIIRTRRESGEDKGDLLSMLLEARDEETGEGMSDEVLRNEVSTMIFAGHETTATTLTWSFYLLDRHPEAGAKLLEELAAVLGGRPPALEDLPNLRYTRMVLEETMRLYPVAWATNRRSIAPDEMGGFRIPANGAVLVCPWVLHRDARFWPEPEEFRPDRFAPENAQARVPYSFVPFGAGPRQCIGNAFALAEAPLILAAVAQRYRLRLVPGHPVEPSPIFVLRPRDGLPMTLHPN